MKWIYLLIAGALEITWAVAMKMSNGFTVLIPSIVTGVGYIASAVFARIRIIKKIAFFIIAHNQAEWYNVRIIKE